jgi:hypothetical protein
MQIRRQLISRFRTPFLPLLSLENFAADLPLKRY